jgi:RecB family exonuclease
MPLVIETKKSGHLHPRLKAFYDRLYEKEKFEKPLYEDGLKMLENAFLYGFDLVPILAVETKFNVEIGDNIILNGIMDKLQNPTPDTLEVVDYKSGVPFSPLEAEKDLQSYMYLMAVRRLIKGYERFIFTFHFLKNRKCYTVAKSPEKLAKFENFIKAQARAMRNICLSTAKPTRSFKCRWCAYATPAGQFTGCPHVR